MRRTVSLSESEDVEVGEYLTRVSKQIHIHISYVICYHMCDIKLITSRTIHISPLSESEDVEVGEYLTRVSKQRPGSNNPKLSDESRQLFSRQKFAKCRGFFVCVEKDKNSPAGF